MTETAPPEGRGAQITDPLINMMIDERYRVISRMARGGMATVYVARDERLDRLVALKVMHPHLAESEQFTARFRREARSAAKVSHPRIVPIYDQGVVQGQGYLVMELVDGPDLRSFLASEGPLTLGKALDFTAQILDGLAAAHRAGVVHRDLKPENILVDSNESLRIVDFGLARAASEVSVSTTGSIMGTVAYLAPEVALNGVSDARTDIFALGIILSEMLTGRLPGGNENPVKVALSRVNEDIPAPSEQTEWLPIEIDELVSSFCARSAAERPASAIDALALLRHTKESIPAEILDRDLPVVAQTAPDDAPHDLTVPVGKAGRTSVLPVQELVVQTSGSVSAPNSRQLTAKSRTWLIITTILLLTAAIALGVWWWWQQYGPGSYLEVPDVATMTVAQAEASLADLNLASHVSYENSDDIPADLVIRTSPEAGQPIHKTAEVQIIVSKGVLMLTVPEVSGLTPEQAESLFAEEGISLGSTAEEWSEDVAAGTVIRSDPTATTSIRHDEDVTLIVSKGREPLPVPDIVNVPRAEAEATLADAGFVAEVSEEYNNDIAEGNVVSQTPVSGQTLHRGDAIAIVVSKGPEFVSVPDVYGKRADEATAQLEQAGFVVEVNRIAGFFSIVGSQSPAAGEQARRGTTVTITVV